MRRDRGMTLIEVILSLSIAGSVFIAIATWTRTVGSLAVDVGPRLAWSLTAEATFRVIADDLTQGDFDPDDDEPHVKVDGAVLSIRTREAGAGSVMIEYAFNPTARTLNRRLIGAGRDEQSANRALIADVDDWSARLDRDIGVLTIALTGRPTSHDQPIHGVARFMTGERIER